ncbi:hypothetical protein [Massilia sp. 9096]|uniref:DUF3108 domain-containing protein n=1 Tax=Massilia sp. 9096 TaxID=1500894 RepID=UPI0005695BC3|nr:hypothetical protein [Massilia sp. 9096]
MPIPRLVLPLAVALVFAGLAAASQAAVQNIDVGTPLARFGLLKPGTHRYLRYLKTGEATQPIDIWTREIRFEPHDGRPQMHIVQRWDGVFPAVSTRTFDSWFDLDTFRPHTHARTSVNGKDGKPVVEGFLFAPDRVTGMQDLAGNTQKDLNVASSEPTFNFETDIEFLQALPLADGYEARVNFYHPGGSTPPQRYTFKVTGSQTIAGPAGPVDCWVVFTDYNTPGDGAKFWFAKGSQLMVRQEGALPDGRRLVKTLIE